MESSPSSCHNLHSHQPEILFSPLMVWIPWLPLCGVILSPTKSEEFFLLRILKVCSIVFWLSVLLLKTPGQSLFSNLHVHTSIKVSGIFYKCFSLFFSAMKFHFKVPQCRFSVIVLDISSEHFQSGNSYSSNQIFLYCFFLLTTSLPFYLCSLEIF